MAKMRAGRGIKAAWSLGWNGHKNAFAHYVISCMRFLCWKICSESFCVNALPESFSYISRASGTNIIHGSCQQPDAQGDQRQAEQLPHCQPAKGKIAYMASGRRTNSTRNLAMP